MFIESACVKLKYIKMVMEGQTDNAMTKRKKTRKYFLETRSPLIKGSELKRR
jgi:hypothetical protein